MVVVKRCTNANADGARAWAEFISAAGAGACAGSGSLQVLEHGDNSSKLCARHEVSFTPLHEQQLSC
jgi:hypothetical protein